MIALVHQVSKKALKGLRVYSSLHTANFVFVVHTMNAMSGAMQLSRWQTSVVMPLAISIEYKAKFTKGHGQRFRA